MYFYQRILSVIPNFFIWLYSFICLALGILIFVSKRKDSDDDIRMLMTILSYSCFVLFFAHMMIICCDTKFFHRFYCFSFWIGIVVPSTAASIMLFSSSEIDQRTSLALLALVSFVLLCVVSIVLSLVICVQIYQKKSSDTPSEDDTNSLSV